MFYDKEPNNFPHTFAEVSNHTLFSKGVKVASAVLCSLIKHAKVSQSQSLLELFKIISLANETRAVNHKLHFS